ncbi:MAG: DEAD/DEAH box helicase family protein [Candidatus Riflebacteria bacterium]|nr:DEAD/DEAH box helicase family protein [Candidatus Riflebacteria bacterium]
MKQPKQLELAFPPDSGIPNKPPKSAPRGRNTATKTRRASPGRIKNKNEILLDQTICLCRSIFTTTEEKTIIEPLFTNALQDIKNYSPWGDPFNAVYQALIKHIIETDLSEYSAQLLIFFYSKHFKFDPSMLEQYLILLAHTGNTKQIENSREMEIKKLDHYVMKCFKGWERADSAAIRDRDNLERLFRKMIVEAEKEARRRQEKIKTEARQRLSKRSAFADETLSTSSAAADLINASIRLHIPDDAKKVPVQFIAGVTAPPFHTYFGRKGMEAFRLACDAQKIHLLKDFDELLCQKAMIGVFPHRHQLETARRVLTRFRGRAILADEVGLGKTIEAGIIIKEYHLRGMIRRVLILVPPALVGQWYSEMLEKFSLRFETTSDQSFKDNPDEFWDRPLIISSMGIARMDKHFSACQARDYDLVIVDEAHHLRNAATKGHKLVENLKRKFLLLLTATPVQNNLLEIFHLINLLRPGTLGTESEFKSRFLNPKSITEPLDPDRLRELLHTSMIRNTRSFVDVKLPRRYAAMCKVVPSAEESGLFNQIQEELRRIFQQDSKGREKLFCANLLEMAGSSVNALRSALERAAGKGELTPALDVVLRQTHSIKETAKDRQLLELIRKAPDKALVFTKFRDTLQHLSSILDGAGIPFAVFHGGLSGAERDRAVELFRMEAQVLLSTESGGEGKNLQFCNTIINYDLPWNPMRIEQRIGRLHRIGQTRDVFIFNMCLQGSVEEKILDILEKKINLFELVVGEIDMILGHMKEGDRFEDLILEIWLGSGNDAERETDFMRLGDQVAKARRVHETVKAVDETLFKDEFEA